MPDQPKDVVVYITDYCPFCHAATKLLKAKGIEFKAVSVDGDDALRAKLVKMSGGRQTVPQIFFGEKSIGGYQELAAYFEK